MDTKTMIEHMTAKLYVVLGLKLPRLEKASSETYYSLFLQALQIYEKQKKK